MDDNSIAVKASISIYKTRKKVFHKTYFMLFWQQNHIPNVKIHRNKFELNGTTMAAIIQWSTRKNLRKTHFK